MWVMPPVSCAWKRRMTFQVLPMMLTHPSCEPRKKLSEPVQMLEISFPSKSCWVSSVGRGILATSKKSNDFHCQDGLAKCPECKRPIQKGRLGA